MLHRRRIPPSARFSLPAAVFHRDGQSCIGTPNPGGRPIFFALLNIRLRFHFLQKKYGRTRGRLRIIIRIRQVLISISPKLDCLYRTQVNLNFHPKIDESTSRKNLISSAHSLICSFPNSSPYFSLNSHPQSDPIYGFFRTFYA